MIAQIDEQQAAMVAHAVHPAGEADGRADIGFAAVRRRCGCGNGAWDWHSGLERTLDRAAQHAPGPKIRAKSAWVPAFVKVEGGLLERGNHMH